MTQTEATQVLTQYAQAVHEKYSLISAMHPSTCSRRGELAMLVLDWLAQGYPEKRIVATLKHFRESVDDKVYADLITVFLREYGKARNEEV